MSVITVTFPNGKKIQIPAGTKGTELIGNFTESKNTIAALRINNEICSVQQPVDISADIDCIHIHSQEGAAIYRRTLCFVLAAAAHELFPAQRLVVGHSLGHGYYYTFDTEKLLSPDDISALQNKMKELVLQNIPITQVSISYKEAVELFTALNLTETRKQLKFICPPLIKINKLNDFSDLYFGPLLERTGMLKLFELRQYQQGFLLRFPASSDPEKLPEFEDIPHLYEIYKWYKTWGKNLNVTSAASLNEIVANRKTKEFINITEALQTKCFADIAAEIRERGQIKVVLMAGPSSSGKTTSSKKLSIQLQVQGLNPKVIELDAYYKNRDQTPKDEHGEYDYECLEALDVQQLNKDLQALLAGDEIQIPSYNFVDGKRYYTGKTLRIEKNDILVMEGIHGLNDKLTPLIPRENKFKIYLSALTQLNLDDHNRIPTSDNRLIRRIVRDAQFRGKSAEETIKMWPNVQKGERLYIFPFQGQADAMLNTALDYELAVLKTYAEPLLRRVPPFCTEYAEASRLLRFLNYFSPIPAAGVPGQSIIREFIGDSDFKY
ncbi:MAG: nucleoside kinase [Bacteroides sp.]|nr:nucleoside kinase [Prevotella sp.]MCM1407780.1 nucleoside kinase [Treponema brennaborense]MCM1468872.1 nucleoside kinase [Bacteroides sp.]